jgi:hypothetical protein
MVGKMAQSANCLADDPEGRVTVCRSCLAIAGYPYEDTAGVRRGHDIRPEAPPLELSRLVILDHDPGAAHELEHEVATFRALQVDRDALLVAPMDRPPDGAPVDHLAPTAHRVALSRRLDLDDVGAQIREEACAERSSNEVAKLKHGQAGKGPGGRFLAGLRFMRLYDHVFAHVFRRHSHVRHGRGSRD